MALINPKPTSAGRRSMIKVVSPELHKGKPYEPLLEKQNKNNHNHFFDKNYCNHPNV